MPKRKRIKLVDEKHRIKSKRIKLDVRSDAPGANKLQAEHCTALNYYFKGYERIAAVPAIYFKGLGDRIEIYELGSLYYVGAIYPDGAAMIWSRTWFEGRSDYIKPSTYEFEPTYSSLMLERRRAKSTLADKESSKIKRKRVPLNDAIIPKRKAKSKTKRVKLNAKNNKVSL